MITLAVITGSCSETKSCGCALHYSMLPFFTVNINMRWDNFASMQQVTVLRCSWSLQGLMWKISFPEQIASDILATSEGMLMLMLLLWHVRAESSSVHIFHIVPTTLIWLHCPSCPAEQLWNTNSTILSFMLAEERHVLFVRLPLLSLCLSALHTALMDARHAGYCQSLVRCRWFF